jgi:uncharacterized membrane protein YozB (DUF420 family)
MSLSDLPTLNALLNFISFVFLSLGYYNIKKRRELIHKRFMISAAVTSALFLISYTIYHYNVGSVAYPYHGWTRPLYFAILIPHVLLAGIMAPFIVVLLYFALSKKFDKHRRLAIWVWPVWMYVSISGILIYLMLYRL